MDRPLADAEVARLLSAARAAVVGAYAPYSGFPVGAAVLTTGGAVFTGVNVENASYGLTVCAERVAVWAAVAAGHRQLRGLALTAPKAPGTTPCGACRQVLLEFAPASGDLTIVLDRGDDPPDAVSLAELLPRAFGGQGTSQS